MAPTTESDGKARGLSLAGAQGRHVDVQHGEVRLEGAFVPVGQPRPRRLGDPAERPGRGVRRVDLREQVTRSPVRSVLGRERQQDAVDADHLALPLPDGHRLEGAPAVAGDLDGERADDGAHGLGSGTVAGVPATLAPSLGVASVRCSSISASRAASITILASSASKADFFLCSTTFSWAPSGCLVRAREWSPGLVRGAGKLPVPLPVRALSRPQRSMLEQHVRWWSADRTTLQGWDRRGGDHDQAAATQRSG